MLWGGLPTMILGRLLALYCQTHIQEKLSFFLKISEEEYHWGTIKGLLLQWEGTFPERFEIQAYEEMRLAKLSHSWIVDYSPPYAVFSFSDCMSKVHQDGIMAWSEKQVSWICAFANLAEELALAFNRHVETQMMESTYETSHQISAHPLGSHWSSVVSDLFVCIHS